MDLMMRCPITWNGDIYQVEVPSPSTAGILLEAFLGRNPNLRGQGLALFTEGGTEVGQHEAVLAGQEYILRPRTVH